MVKSYYLDGIMINSKQRNSILLMKRLYKQAILRNTELRRGHLILHKQTKDSKFLLHLLR